jgi:hypothetical protein
MHACMPTDDSVARKSRHAWQPRCAPHSLCEECSLIISLHRQHVVSSGGVPGGRLRVLSWKRSKRTGPGCLDEQCVQVRSDTDTEVAASGR